MSDIDNKTSNQNIIEAYDIIHGRLADIPAKYCFWKEKNGNNHSVSYFEKSFSFIKNDIIKQNISRLRLCFEYQATLYKLHKPNSWFEIQHRYILAQTIASIYEGILLDLFYFKNGFGLKNKDREPSFIKLVNICKQEDIINEEWKQYLINLGYLRNTIHPKIFFIEKDHYLGNPLIKCEVDDFFTKFNEFIEKIKKIYL